MEEILPEPIIEKPIRTRKAACIVCAKDVFEQDSYVTDKDRHTYHPEHYTITADRANDKV